MNYDYMNYDFDSCERSQQMNKILLVLQCLEKKIEGLEKKLGTESTRFPNSDPFILKESKMVGDTNCFSFECCKCKSILVLPIQTEKE